MGNTRQILRKFQNTMLLRILVRTNKGFEGTYPITMHMPSRRSFLRVRIPRTQMESIDTVNFLRRLRDNQRDWVILDILDKLDILGFI